MADSIETAVVTETKTAETAVKTDITSLKSRMSALESEAAGYVRAHVVYFVGGICLIVGIVAGHVFR
jgi:hypothetical protein